MKVFAKLSAATAILVTTAMVPVTLLAQEAEVVTVVKVTGENWFTRMETGVDSYGAQSAAIETRQVGPAQADAAQQTAIVQDLVAQGVDALAIVPMDPSTLEGVLRRARGQGVTVITHEAESMVNTDVDLEAFDNTEFGKHLNRQLAECMGGEGIWTTFVGSVGSLTHMQWAGGGIENAAENHPGMTLVSENNESFNDPNNAYEIARELLRTYPDIKGFQGSSAIDVIGIGRAVEEAGLQDETCVFGIGLPQDSGQYLDTGAIDGIGFWDPRDAGIVMNMLAEMVLAGEEFTDGMDLGIPGYNTVSVTAGAGEGIIIRGEAWVDVDASNWQEYPF